MADARVQSDRRRTPRIGLAPAATESRPQLLPRDTRSTPDALEAWSMVRAALEADLPAPAFEMYVAPLVVAGEHENGLCVQGQPHIAAHVRRVYGDRIGAAVRELTDYRGAFIGQAPELEEVNDEGGLL